MKKVFLLAVMICGIVALAASNVWAACGSPTYIGHGLDSYFICDDSKPAQALIYEFGNPSGDNSGILRVACLSVGNSPPIGVDCIQNGSGTPTDHQITIETDAILPQWVGCPVVPGVPAKRLVVVVTDASGQSLTASVSGLDPGLGYLMEGAHPFDGSNVLPVACGNRARLTITSMTVSAGTATLGLHQDAPTVVSDCDPGSLGFQLGSACLDAVGAPDHFSRSAFGSIYTQFATCGAPPTISPSAWTRQANTPNAAGNSTLVIPLSTTGQCLFISGSNTFSTNASTSPELLNGFVSVPPQGAATAKADKVQVARTSGGDINVSWVSNSEINLAAYKVLGDNKTKGLLDLATESPKGGGGAASYTVKIRMGDLKGTKSIIVRALLTDGTSIDAAAVSF
jgi:hypothetical protein